MRISFLLFLVGVLMVEGCQGQNKKEIVTQVNDSLVTFEKKQSQALENISNTSSANSMVGGFNFRIAARKATAGVVHIKSFFAARADREVPEFFKDFFGNDLLRQYFNPGTDMPQPHTSIASGVIISSDGYIVTNNHVVNEADSIEIVLHDKRSYNATVVGVDPSTDLALLKINETKLAFIAFGNSDSVEVGDIVLAVGNPFNFASTVTAGIVSAKARNINIISDKSAVESYIQTDAAVNRGNSGGALVDVAGKLIGINAAIATPTGVYAGYSFAIPIEIVKKVSNDLLRYGKVVRGYLGAIVSEMNSEKANTLGIHDATGVMVDSLIDKGAAQIAGIKTKDVITKIDNQPVESAPQLLEIIARHRPLEKLKVTINRGGKERDVFVTLQPAIEIVKSPNQALDILNVLGIEISNLSIKEKNLLKIEGGVKVVSINKGKIIRYTNMQEGFVITKLNGKLIQDRDAFIKELQNKKGGILIEGVYPGVQGVYYYALGL